MTTLSGAEPTRFLKRSAGGFTGLPASRFDLVAALTGRRRDFGTALQTAIPGIPRLDALAIGARLRLTTADTLVPDETREARFETEQFERALATGLAPSSWMLWTRAESN